VGELVLSALLFATCLSPLLYLVVGTRFGYEQLTPWLTALFGAILPRVLAPRWNTPRPLKGPLVFWVLALALTWPVLTAREVDFTPELLYRSGLAVSKLGVQPSMAISWMLTTTIVAMLGLLLFETFAALYGAAPVERFESRIVWPAYTGCFIAAL